MEILDLYDDKFRLLDETIIRGNNPDIGKNIKISLAYIKRGNGDYLIQRTSKSKGSKFSSTGGHVQHGETGLEALVRELNEELGLVVNKEKLKYVVTWKHPRKRHIFDIYLLDAEEINIDKLKLQEEEVEFVRWMTVKEIEKLIEDDKFIESHAYIFNNYIKL